MNRNLSTVMFQAATIALFLALTLPSAVRATDDRSGRLPPLLNQQPQPSQVPTTPLIEPKSAADFLKRGISKAKTNDLESAIVDFNQAIALKRDYAAAFYNRAITYANLGNLRASLADYTQVILLKPNNAYVRYDRGLIRTDLKDYKGAIEDFQQAASLFKQQLNVPFQQKALTKLQQLQQL